LKLYDWTHVKIIEERVRLILNRSFENILPYGWTNIDEVKRQKTLKWYKERYEQMIRDREEYNEKLLWALRGMDMRISEEKKKEILDNIEVDMKKEIDDLKQWDKTMKEAKAVEKWLIENWKSTMEMLLYLKKKIEEEKRGKGKRLDRKMKIVELKEAYKQVKIDLDEKLKLYDWSDVWEDEIFIETFEERELKITKNLEKENYAKMSLDSYRKVREKWMNIDSEIKEKIVKASDKIVVRMSIESDWSRMIEMKIWWKSYKILDVDIKTHSDIKYMDVYGYEWGYRNEVKLWWMRWNDLYWWKNYALKEYVKKRQYEWLHIPKIEEMRELLVALWKEADISEERDQIAMLMYLTGMYGCYWLSMWNRKQSTVKKWRSILECVNAPNFSDACYDTTSGILCMIAY